LTKQNIRKQVIAQRAAWTRSQFWRLNDDLLTQIEKFNWENSNCLHLFLPITKNKEVDTFEILSFFRTNFPAIKIVVSKTNFKTKSVNPIYFDYENTVLVKNKYEIPEPLYGKECPIENIDTVLIPLLGFDLAGNRVGYGAGFYDRFLAQCNPEVFKIGLSLIAPFDEIEDVNEFDIKMDYCITTDKVYKF
jgi:5-formyltetrahydrofolate cyclo-ligase